MKFQDIQLKRGKSYKNVSNNLYVGNYIGFANINDYDNIDLYDSYLTIFLADLALLF